MGGGGRKKGNMHALRIINNAEYFYTFLVQCQADNFNGEPYSCLHQSFRKEMGQVVTAYSLDLPFVFLHYWFRDR